VILAMLATLVAVGLAFAPGRPITRLAPIPAGPRRRKGRPVLPVVIAAVLVSAVVAGPRVGVLLALGVGVAATAATLWSRYRRRRLRRERRVEVAEGCAVLAREVRAGRAPVQALMSVAEDHPSFAPAAAAHRVGGSIPRTLRDTAGQPGREGMAQLARAWEVSTRTGAALAPTLDVVSRALRAEQQVARTTAGELAAPRATGQMLGLLPVAGIVLGFLLGGNPIDFLLTSGYGLACLVGGVGLTCAGLLWSDRLGDPR